MNDSRSFSSGCAALVIGAAIILLGAILLFGPWAIVPAGHVGVLTTWGKVEPNVLHPGLHWKTPFVQGVVNVETRILPIQFKEIDAASKEYQTVKVTGTLNYHLDAEHADEIVQRIGLDFDDKVINPALNDFVKEVVPRYSVAEVLPKRDEIRGAAIYAMNENLNRYGLYIDDIYISNISFSDEYQHAIEAKQTAQQNVEREQQILNQKEVQARQVAVDARAQGDARLIAATAEAQANKQVAESVTPQLIEYQRWSKWNGQLPSTMLSDDNSMVTIPR